MSSVSAMQSNSKGQNEDEDCKIVYNKAESPTEPPDVLPQVTEELAKEGLEIIKEVPSPSFPRTRLRSAAKSTEESKYIETISSDECPTGNEDSQGSDVEWVPSPEVKKPPKQTKRSRKASKSEGKDNEGIPAKKPKVRKPRASPKKKAAKSSEKEKELVIPDTDETIVTPEEKQTVPVNEIKPVVPEQKVFVNEIKPMVPESKVFVNENGLLSEQTKRSRKANKSEGKDNEGPPTKKPKQFMVPNQAVGRIIGKKGVVIRKIQQDSGARVYIREGNNGLSRYCLISGTHTQIQSARSFINDIINSVMPSRNSSDKADVEIVKEFRSSFVQTDFEDEEGTGNMMRGVKHAFASNSISSPTEIYGEQPPPKKPKLDAEAGPSNGNENSCPKKKKSPAAKKPAKSVGNAKGKGKQKKEEQADDDIILIESSEAAPVETSGDAKNNSKKPAYTPKFDESLRLWRDEDVVAEAADININIARNIINLFNQECTIPFIARYRKELTGSMAAEKLREVQECFEAIKSVKKKVDNIIKTLAKEGKLNEKIEVDMMNAKTSAEVDILYAPFKPGNKKTLAERAKKLGLEEPANQLLNGTASLPGLNIERFVKPKVKGIENVEEVMKGIQHIIADNIAKDRQVLDFTKQKCKEFAATITSQKSASAEKEDKQAHVEGKETNNFKFENYFNFNMSSRFVKAHQVLAINRGESQKVLTVKVVIPKPVKFKTLDMCWYKFCAGKITEPETKKFMEGCIEDAYNRLIEPHLCRTIRSELTKKADKESVTVFCDNLKRLLLSPPVRGKTVLGVDPGFKHGCKLAVISCSGELLLTDVIFPHLTSSHFGNNDADKLKQIISTYNIDVIAIGNGTACRETETWLSRLIKARLFGSQEVKFCIVSEIGASIYSVSKQADLDLPGIDPNCRSAVSIARRLQDPLLEYVKVEPKHLGVGMYQHDVAEAMLKTALDGVVIECVSFVGVDLNVCPEVLLRKISGLTASRAQNIIEWREKNGPFKNRQQLLSVKGLGPKSFEQCAGFVKIFPQTTIDKRIVLEMLGDTSSSAPKKKRSKPVVPATENPLDTTIIHPESYDVAEKFLLELNSSPHEIGKSSLIEKVNNYMRFTDVSRVAEKFNVPEPRMQLIIDAFSQLMNYDIRDEFEKPLFHTGVTSLNDLIVNSNLTGCVRNVTHFGAFVDIGVGTNGLIHVSQMKRQKLSLGDRVKVQVIAVDIRKKRISLRLCEKQS